MHEQHGATSTATLSTIVGKNVFDYVQNPTLRECVLMLLRERFLVCLAVRASLRARPDYKFALRAL